MYRRRVYTLTESSDDAGSGNGDSDSDNGMSLNMAIYKMSFIHGLKVASAAGQLDAIDFGSLDNPALYERLDDARILWRFVDAPHAGDGFSNNDAHFLGTMPAGGFVADSGLRYEDELVLTKEDLWVSEQVYTADGNLVGGNQEAIPHKMRRVRPDGDLRWTLDRNLPDFNAV